ncbi:HAD hydrolase family protein [Micropruina sp.]|uniref:HAD hydrolase family protein n=1 Tax=Micropruina sp. TaxID=2737536 RepID=UPI0039E29093
MGKTVFIDFDGTYAHNGVIPEGHVRAVEQARRNGHRVLLCTGRPKILVAPDHAAVFDGLVAAAGGYVELDGMVLADRRFPADLARRAVELLEANDAVYILEGPDAAYVTSQGRDRLRRLITQGEQAANFGKAADGILGPLQITDDPASETFAKITCFQLAVPSAELAARLGPEVDVVPSSIGSLGERAGEFFLAGVDKSVGIAVVERHFGLDRADIIAIGDGHNDLEMVAYAGTGVAIEGGVPELLALADLIVPAPQHEGLVAAFERLGLIDPPAQAA